MKILLINSYYLPDYIGGAEKCCELTAEQLLKRGHEVIVFCLKHSTQKEYNGVNIYRCDAGKFDVDARMNNSGKFFTRLRNKIIETNNKSISTQLIELLKEFKPDVAHCNNIYGLSSIVWKILHDYNVPIVQTIHDYWFFNGFSYKSNNSLFKMYHKYYYKKRSKFVKFAIAPSKTTIDVAIENKSFFKNADLSVIPNGIVMDINDVNEICDYKISNLKDDSLNLLFVGRLDENKGIINLIEAFLKLDKSFTLHICGQGPQKEEMLNLIKNKDNIIYHGMLSQKDLYDVYKKVDVVVVPSIWNEPFGLVVIEAMINGCPVIGSQFGGIKEIIDYTNAGITINPNDEDDIIDKIIIMKSPETRLNYIKMIKERIYDYSIQKHIDRYEEMYKKCLM